MEALTALLIIAGAILNIALIVKFWGMCNDIKDIRNHIVKKDVISPAERTETATPIVETLPNEDGGGGSFADKEIDNSGLWVLGIFGVIAVIIILVSVL